MMARAQPLIHRSQQHRECRHPGVDMPVRCRPTRLVPMGPPLVRLGVAVQVGVLVRHGDHYQRRVLYRRSPFGANWCKPPEPLAVGFRSEHEKRPPLCISGRRRTQRRAHHALDDIPLQRLSRVVPDHSSLPQYLRKLHCCRVCASMTRLPPTDHAEPRHHPCLAGACPSCTLPEVPVRCAARAGDSQDSPALGELGHARLLIRCTVRIGELSRAAAPTAALR